MFSRFITCVREAFETTEYVPLHEPAFVGNERAYLIDTIDSTYVSSVGAYVDRFEELFAAYTGAAHAICTVNGTAALHVALELAGVGCDDEVVTQPLSFVATCNAICYTGATPVFIDVDRETLGLSPEALAQWLQSSTTMREGLCINRRTARPVRACVVMHTFGHIGEIEQIAAICRAHNIELIEDAAESTGSTRNEVHSGRTGTFGAFSFNGNKIITTGGGGALITDDPSLAQRAKHLTTTAKLAHAWEFSHDQVGYNYRMPNINAALGCAQLELLDTFLGSKRALYEIYRETLTPIGFQVLAEPSDCRSNFWLNALVLESRAQRDEFLAYTNAHGIMTRPVWNLLNTLSMFQACECGPLPNAQWLADRVVNIPSSARINSRV